MRTAARAAVVLLILGLGAVDAAAWGPRAQRAITVTALQMVRRTMPDAFRAEESNYEADLLRGALAGVSQLRECDHVGEFEEVINLIGTEIQLLREARRHEPSSYFSYRMGVLGALMSDAVLPFALDPSPEAKRLLKAMQTDIDKHLRQYSFIPIDKDLAYIRNPQEYLKKRRTYYEDARLLVKADYDQGVGYDGYLRKGGEALFEEAVQAVADAWFTVLRVEGDPSDVRPSAESVTWYLADEIDYLLTVKHNQLEAEKVYDTFADVNPDILPAYETVGDSFYAYGAKERGVAEWKIALAFSGPDRDRVLGKLSGHFLREGKALLAIVGAPDAPDTALDDALRNFEEAFVYDRRNKDAETLITETKVAIAEREERRALAAETIARAEQVKHEAESAELSRSNYGEAIAKYKLAINVFGMVDDEFDEHYTAAMDNIDECKTKINRIITSLLEQAQDKIDEGDRLIEDNAFDEAIQQYRSVPTILSLLADEPGADYANSKARLLEEAKKKEADVGPARERFDAQQAAEKKRLLDQATGGTQQGPAR
ncbi:MAG: hypothetical protein JXR94_14630 [Candidatus Hydrogenedentes bacterium]|nr:hypothetical protein [Candidatus Hydrogenedentota bacterium]